MAARLCSVQDILVSAALAECSYKAVDHTVEEALRLTREILAVGSHLELALHHICILLCTTWHVPRPWLLRLQDLVPPQLITLQSVQFCQPHVRHRYCLAESDEALYVGIMGTKMR